MKTVDLHLHSTASDGSLTPEELVRQAKSIGLSAIALTDHDTVDGLDAFMQAGNDLQMETIRGIETAVVQDDCDVHLVCLFFDPHHPAMAKQLREMAINRQERNVRMIAKLNKKGFPISPEDFREYGERAIARGHIAQVLVRNQLHGKNPKEIVKEYLSKGKVGYVRRKTPEPEKFIDIVHQAGGLVFVAHLNQIDREDPENGVHVFEQLVKKGVDGLETRYPEYDDFWEKKTKELADRYGLLEAGGSDFHGDIKPGLLMGSGYENLSVPYSFLEQMKQKLQMVCKEA